MITDQKVNSKFVGIYVIGESLATSVQIATTHKPNWFRRFSMWAFLGWKWMSIADLKKTQVK
jgi:hypothetical protein